MKTSYSDLCYVVPTGSKVEDGFHTRSLILNGNDESLEAKTYPLDTQVLPGYIMDTSFIPSELDKECSVYQWMTVSRQGKSSTYSSTMFTLLPLRFHASRHWACLFFHINIFLSLIDASCCLV